MEIAKKIHFNHELHGSGLKMSWLSVLKQPKVAISETPCFKNSKWGKVNEQVHIWDRLNTSCTFEPKQIEFPS